MSTEPLTPSWDNTAKDPKAVNDDEPRPVRIGTVVWGLVVAAVGIIILVAAVFGFTVNAGQVFTGLLAGAGLALVAGGIISAVRSKSRNGGA